jgi:mono/diheme cytochrome c family protein
LALGADFLLRALGYRKYSPLATVARTIVSALRLDRQTVNAAPKQFAAKIGVGFALTAAVLAFLGLTLAAQLVAAGLLGAAGLEAFLGYCVGCKIYALLPRRPLLEG